jgi:hypothetical protein
MAEGKKSFMAYVDWGEIFNQLDDDQAGRLAKHLFAYVNDEDPQSEDAIINLAFTPIKQQLKRDLVKWEERAERSRSNGSKGGRPPKEEKPSGFSGLSEKPGKPDTVDVTVTVDVDDTVKEKVIKKKPSGFQRPTLEEITAYCSERGNTIDPAAWLDHYESNGWKVGRNAMKDWKAAVRTWERNGFEAKTVGGMPNEWDETYVAKHCQDPNKYMAYKQHLASLGFTLVRGGGRERMVKA